MTSLEPWFRTWHYYFQKVAALCAFGPTSCHNVPSVVRHCLEAGYDIEAVQELLGHKDVKTTVVYTHVSASVLKLRKDPNTAVRMHGKFKGAASLYKQIRG
ncbi:tyrosine-type recombinase/integrase [Brevibacillus sp. NPDC058079]|uniref:tyrosine-type recombinase/integrase n=1 Tax=Brevibacillus sp. NPDC058079 TaxID=3346330 RepID=UPI0036E4018E